MGTALLKALEVERAWYQPSKEPGCAGGQARLDVEPHWGPTGADPIS